ncbi:hypothetical protein K8Q93_02770 [Candidatus Parcubacteria bacterium]|nr:hypothetical protein [Candidatus Parcubacteria bacterium]
MNYKRLIRYIPHALILLVVLGLTLAYFQGFRLTRSGIAYPGSITLEVPRAGSQVFLDQKELLTTATSSEKVLLQDLSAGSHTVVVGRDGYWPWQKTVRVPSKGEAVARSFNVPQNASGLIITDKDPEYWTTVNSIKSEILPSPETRRVSEDKSVAIWVDEEGIHAAWLLGENRTPYFFCPEGECTDLLTVYRPKDEVRSLDFYPGRSDVVILAASNGVYALEIDRTGTQNFQPIYKGSLPSFILSEYGTLLIEDGGHLFEVSL